MLPLVAPSFTSRASSIAPPAFHVWSRRGRAGRSTSTIPRRRRAVHEVVPRVAVEQRVERPHDDQTLRAVGDEGVVVDRVDLLLLVLGPDLSSGVDRLGGGQRNRGCVPRLHVEPLAEGGNGR